MTLQSIFWCTIHSTLCKLKSNFPDCANQKERERKKNILISELYDMYCTEKQDKERLQNKENPLHFLPIFLVGKIQDHEFQKNYLVFYPAQKYIDVEMMYSICYFTNFETIISGFPRFCYRKSPHSTVKVEHQKTVL